MPGICRKLQEIGNGTKAPKSGFPPDPGINVWLDEIFNAAETPVCDKIAKLSLQLPLAEYLYLQCSFVVRPACVTSPLREGIKKLFFF